MKPTVVVVELETLIDALPPAEIIAAELRTVKSPGTHPARELAGTA
jgi:hypothetical protein